MYPSSRVAIRAYCPYIYILCLRLNLEPAKEKKMWFQHKVPRLIGMKRGLPSLPTFLHKFFQKIILDCRKGPFNYYVLGSIGAFLNYLPMYLK